MSSVRFAVVVAADEDRGIGKAGTLPWRLSGDMAYFKRVTSTASPGKRNAVIMGRKTFESIPLKFRPLAGRLNVVLSRNAGYRPEGAVRVGSLDEALAASARAADVEHTFVIGGGDVYNQALLHPDCARVLATRVHATFDCDTHLAPFEDRFRLVSRNGPHDDNGVRYTFEVYE